MIRIHGKMIVRGRNWLRWEPLPMSMRPIAAARPDDRVVYDKRGNIIGAEEPMGHYDDHYAESDRKDYERKQERIKARAEKIRTALNQVGIERVLAELMEDNKSYG